MNVLTYEVFDSCAELAKCELHGGYDLKMVFNTIGEGFIKIGSHTARIASGECNLDLRLVDDGEFEPLVITRERTLKLPKIKKHAKQIDLCGAEIGFVLELSLRERRLEEKVKALEEDILRLRELIIGKSIF